MFSDLCESTRLAASMEAEDYAELLGALRAAAAQRIGEHGGMIVRIDGDGLAAIFGHPEAHENDGRRATEAAIDLHAAADGLGAAAPAGGVRLHTGIHSGLVLFYPGDLVRGRFEMLGDATNVAARLADAAAPGEILVSAATLGADRHFFSTGGLRELRLTGKERPLAVLPVTGREPLETRFAARARRGVTPFIGREPELARLDRCLDAAGTGVAGLAVIAGPPGLGKSRLAGEALARAAERGWAVHRGYCESYLGAEPFQPFLQILRSICSIEAVAAGAPVAEALSRRLTEIDPALAGHRDELLRWLSPRAANSAPPGAAEAVAGAIAGICEALAARRPLLLFIDDWQWADDATCAVLRRLRDIAGRSVLILVATRQLDAGLGQLADAEVLELSPLSPDETTITVASLLNADDPFVAAEVHDRSGGNPLFIEELCHAVAGGGTDAPRRDAGGWLNSLIESRVARLGDEQAELVRIAAVIGNIIPAWLFEQLTGYPAGHPLVASLAAADFIFPGAGAGTLRFKHGLTRDAVYQSVGLHARRALHRRVAAALLARAAAGSGEDVLEPLAYHFGAGGDPERAAHYAELAGDKASAASALDRAQALYTAALEALDRLPATPASYARWMSLVRRLGATCVYDPTRSQLPVFEAALARATARGDTSGVAWAEFLLAGIHLALGDARASSRCCARALAAAAPADARLAGRIRAALGQARVVGSDCAAALPLLDEAIAAASPRERGRAPTNLAFTISCKAFALADSGAFGAAEACFEEAITLVRQAQHVVEASVLSQWAAACLWQGRHAEARAHADHGVRVSERVKTRYIYGMCKAQSAYARWRLDGAPAALAELTEATAWLEASDRLMFLSLNHGWLAEAMVETGQLHLVRGYARRALQRTRRHDRYGEAMAWRALARAAAQGGQPRPPQHYLDRAERCATARGSAHEAAANALCAAELAVAAGSRTAARAALADARGRCAALSMRWHLAAVDRLALIADRSA